MKNNSLRLLPEIKVLRVDNSKNENMHDFENKKSNQRITVIFVFNRMKKGRSVAEIEYKEKRRAERRKRLVEAWENADDLKGLLGFIAFMAVSTGCFIAIFRSVRFICGTCSIKQTKEIPQRDNNKSFDANTIKWQNALCLIDKTKSR